MWPFSFCTILTMGIFCPVLSKVKAIDENQRNLSSCFVVIKCYTNQQIAAAGVSGETWWASFLQHFIIRLFAILNVTLLIDRTVSSSKRSSVRRGLEKAMVIMDVIPPTSTSPGPGGILPRLDRVHSKTASQSREKWMKSSVQQSWWHSFDSKSLIY